MYFPRRIEHNYKRDRTKPPEKGVPCFHSSVACFLSRWSLELVSQIGAPIIWSQPVKVDRQNKILEQIPTRKILVGNFYRRVLK